MQCKGLTLYGAGDGRLTTRHLVLLLMVLMVLLVGLLMELLAELLTVL